MDAWYAGFAFILLNIASRPMPGAVTLNSGILHCVDREN